MPSLKQTIVNKRPWTGVEEKNPSSLEIIEKRFRTQPSDQPTDEPDVSIAESSTESDNESGKHLFLLYLVQHGQNSLIHAMFKLF